ncbi:hypothetical protein [Stutzerimonas nitrititolerans]|uniref:hypothetical protein n=1 Tax=Stutzerimonas nitrititolerans TaxID=2482751 RepID=UPI002897FACC|nr:hypothetical protein [Stutzerimonas nitrititolerans]
MTDSELAPEVSIKYSFIKNRQNPAQVFEAMALYINAYRDLTQLLAIAVGVEVNFELKLNDIEKSSLLSKISAVRNTIGDAIEENLYKSGERLFKELIPETETKTAEQVDCLAKALEHELSENFLTQLLPPCIDREKLAYVLEAFSMANQKVLEEESIIFLQTDAEGDGCRLNTSWRFTGDPKTIFSGRTESRRHADRLIITVAVYVGKSLWSFQSLSSEKKFSAKITDELWLNKYQSGLIPIGPKDVIEAEIMYDLYTPPVGQGPSQMRNARVVKVIDIHRNNAYQHEYGF